MIRKIKDRRYLRGHPEFISGSYKMLKRVQHDRIGKNGFTLIEILVVIAIIGMILALAMPNFFAARQRARDAARKSDLKQIQKALELYKSDQNPVGYPTVYPLACVGNCQINIGCGTKWDNGGTNTYMSKIPCDPLGPTPYYYNPSSTTTYALVACLENASDADKDSTNNVAVCTTSGTVSYTLNEP